MVTRRIEKAQKKVEECNFDERKNLLEYDEVMDDQRKRVYGSGRRSSTARTREAMILDMIDEPDRRRRSTGSSPTTTARPASPSAPATGSASSSTPRDFRGVASRTPRKVALRQGHHARPDRHPGADRGEPEPGRGPEGLEVERADAGR